ncbi:ROK family protein [Wenxinia saemankumensis]|uniref:Sugar kinase of the NBD/HSP70 family, may contain an N-terminal HTH domain n=1 Tax=Wenxinia saemankumensis TaxID=1447782 RepID=A0A1M6HTB9_9RHOB|nr:ROK family protein [Wenxinia saemankumensis]SHJ25430.1 Sugar kinase of the NBD/HSP70 family, may contain an N-terminal HTH domain [Wenxinia saemankumensis]
MDGDAPPVGLTDPASAALANLLRGRALRDPHRRLREEGWTDGEGRLRADRALLLVSDIGGTKMLTALCDLRGGVLAETTDPTPDAGAPALVDRVIAQRDALLGQIGRPCADIAAAGLGVPASIDPATGRLHRGPNIPGLEEGDLAGGFAAALGRPVAIENDVNMAALGEHWRGGTRRADLTVFIAIGTGIGMGVVIGDRLLRGATGAAGEIAFLPLGADPEDPATHAMGPLEHAISSEALMRVYRAAGGRADSLRDAFARPDPALDEVLDQLALWVARSCQAVAAILDPEAIVFGGSLGFRPEVLGRVEAVLARSMARPPACRVTALGPRAALVGAARAARTALAASIQG